MGKFEVLRIIINDKVIELHNENEIEDFYRTGGETRRKNELLV